MMQGSRAAARYAKALLSLAKDKNVTKEVNDDMTTHHRILLDNSGELRIFLKAL